MNISTEDRRVRKTKKALREGLAELMLEKDLRNITVRELVDKIDIHRATFYVHYKDIYDLYEQMEDMIVNELCTIIDGEVSGTYEALFEALISYVSDNSKICRMFLNKNGNRSFIDRISAVLEEKYLEIWQHDLKQKEIHEEWRFFASYHIRGCLAIVSTWEEHDFLYPKEKLTGIIIKIDTNFDKLISK